MSSSHPENTGDHPGVIGPPPLIFAGILLIALLLDWSIAGPATGLSWELRAIAGSLLGGAGLALIIIAIVQFHFARTNVEPWKPTTAIVTSGVYRFSRNPIYLGMALGYVGLGLLADSVIALACLPLALAAMHYGVILREERYLTEKFGEDYIQYKEKSRRWI